jgi:hypothetical protein
VPAAHSHGDVDLPAAGAGPSRHRPYRGPGQPEQGRGGVRAARPRSAASHQASQRRRAEPWNSPGPGRSCGPRIRPRASTSLGRHTGQLDRQGADRDPGRSGSRLDTRPGNRPWRGPATEPARCPSGCTTTITITVTEHCRRAPAPARRADRAGVSSPGARARYRAVGRDGTRPVRR